MGSDLTIGERIAWYRRRRGMSQEVLAGRVGRTVDWLSKIENNRIGLDRLSIIKVVAAVLDVTVGDLLAEPSLMDWPSGNGQRTVPALRDALMSYRQITPLLGDVQINERPDLDSLTREVEEAWADYQASKYLRLTHRLPLLLAEAQSAADEYSGTEGERAHRLLALVHHSAAALLTKLGETDLSWIAADRGLVAARSSGDVAVTASLLRSVTHALLSNSRFDAAVQLTKDAAAFLQPSLVDGSPDLLSVYGMQFLAGSVAASRAEDRSTTRSFLDEADEAATRLGTDANYMWTAFGPTNVAIHRVATAMELGDVQVAIDLAPRIDASVLPVERQVRHALELARAYNAWNRSDEALGVLLDAEQLAPEQVRYHYLSRELVVSWVRQERGRPSYALTELARRLQVLR